jgi:type IV secretory pathway VirJ component
LLLCLATATQAAPQSAAPAAAVADQAQQHLQVGRFGRVSVYVPQGLVRTVAIFVSGDGGWELGVINMAQALRAAGALVIGVDVRHYFASLHQAAAQPQPRCQLLAGDFENLSHQVQKQLGMAEYLLPALVGYSSGATVVYAALVQSPPGTFSGALSLGFCADQDFAGAELCLGEGLHYAANAQHELVFRPATTLRQPWVALQGQKDEVCSPQAAAEFATAVTNGALVSLPLVGHGFSVERNWMPQFLQAYARISAQPASTAPERAAGIADLPLEEVGARDGGSELALLLTGDGGWAGLDQGLAAQLARQGVPTVALNSLKYFWRARTPEEAAQAVERILRHYLGSWHKTRVLLIGYSFGADVLPFVVNRLPQELRAQIASVSLLGVDAHASFEVHLSEWVGSDDSGPQTRPEVLKLPPLPVLCLSGAGEQDSLCPQLPAGITHEQVGSGHHFGGEYATLAERILAFARSPRPVT